MRDPVCSSGASWWPTMLVARMAARPQCPGWGRRRPSQRRPEGTLQARGRDSRRPKLVGAQLVRAQEENLARRAAGANCAPGGRVRPRLDEMPRRNSRRAPTRRSRLQTWRLQFSTFEIEMLPPWRLEDATMQDSTMQVLTMQ